MESEVESLSAYHPVEYPPRKWHLGPKDSEMEATGRAYFRVGRESVVRMTRATDSGVVRIDRKGLPTLIHSQRGWCLAADD